MTAGHPLAKARQLNLAQLQPYPLALPEPDTTVRQLFDIACHWRRLHLEPTLTCSHISSLISLLRNSPNAITISGEITTRYQVERGDLVSIRLRDRGLDLRNIEVQTLLGRTMSRSAQAFLDYLKLQLSKH